MFWYINSNCWDSSQYKEVVVGGRNGFKDWNLWERRNWNMEIF